MVDVIGVPSDLGANQRGSNMGPAAIRMADLKAKVEQMGYEVIDSGDTPVPIRDSLPPDQKRDHYLTAIRDICQDLCHWSYKALEKGRLPLAIGGDHSLAMGTIAGVAQHFAQKKQDIGLIWVDAHADLNTPESSESGNIHGMPLSTLLGVGHDSLVAIGGRERKVKPEQVALIGIRNLDSKEKQILKQSGISYFTMRDIDELGMFQVMKEAIQIASKDTAGIHLSFDIDAIDPLYAPGVSTPVAGGLNFREAHLLLEILAETGQLTSIDFVELNPYTDQSATSANLTVDLICSALGKSII